MEDRSKRRARLLLIVGVILAVVAFGATLMIAQGGRTAAPQQVPLRPVLVAARDIPPKTQITAADLRAIQINTAAAPVTAIAPDQQATVVGKVAVNTIQAGDFITVAKLGTAQGATFTVFPPELEIPAGGEIPANTPSYRAMSLTIPDQFAVGGAVQPGDLVDLMYVLPFDPAKFLVRQTGVTPGSAEERIADTAAKIVLERVPIIARLAAVYTIRTDAATAEQIAYLQATGAQLQLLLRAPIDSRPGGTQGATFGPVYERFQFPIPERVTP